jgi:hypothetical protein
VIVSGGGWQTSFHCIRIKTTLNLVTVSSPPSLLLSANTRGANNKKFTGARCAPLGTSRRLVNLDNNFAIDPCHRYPRLNVLSAWPQRAIAQPDHGLGKIVHDKIRVDARRDDLVARVRSAHRERPRTRPVSSEQPRRRVFHHETCRVESVLSPHVNSHHAFTTLSVSSI